MSENTKKTQITVDDTKYDFNDLTPEQQVLFQHCIDLKLLAARCNISKELSTYVLRHTAATWMLRKGVPITTISSILGHNKIETTLIYAKLEKQIMKEQMISAFAKPPENKPRNSEQVQPEQS